MFQLIGSCFFIIKHILRSGDGIFQCLYFAWADIVHIRQDIGIDELDRFFQVCFQRICAFTGIQCLHRFTQVEQCADECGRGSIIWISKQCVGIGDQIVQLIVLQRFCLIDDILQCGHGGLACLSLQSIHRGTQCRCCLTSLFLRRLLIGCDLFRALQCGCERLPAVCRMIILLQQYSLCDQAVELILKISDDQSVDGFTQLPFRLIDVILRRFRISEHFLRMGIRRFIFCVACRGIGVLVQLRLNQSGERALIQFLLQRFARGD